MSENTSQHEKDGKGSSDLPRARPSRRLLIARHVPRHDRDIVSGLVDYERAGEAYDAGAYDADVRGSWWWDGRDLGYREIQESGKIGGEMEGE